MKYPLYLGQEVRISNVIPESEYAIIREQWDHTLTVWGVNLFSQVTPSLWTAVNLVEPWEEEDGCA